MRHAIRNSFLVLGMLVFFISVVIPPEKNLRLGKDLRGGVTLLYSVKMDPSSSQSPKETLDQIITVLKDRIDPQGLLEIQMIPQGQDRIEITMPLPGPEVIRYREAFEAELQTLISREFSEDRIERAMRLGPGPEREEELILIAAGDEGILAALRTAGTSFDEAQAARLAIDALPGETPPEIVDEYVIAAADAEIAYESARDNVLAASVSEDEVRRILRLSTDTKSVLDESTDDFVSLGSARSNAIDAFLEDHPDLEGKMTATVDAYDFYLENRNSLDDPEDLKRLVSSSGVLSFRIAIDPEGTTGSTNTHPEEGRLRAEFQQNGPGGVSARDARWFPINRIESWVETLSMWESLQANPAAFFRSQGYVGEEYNGEYYILLWDTRTLRLTPNEGRWGVSASFQTSDQQGKPAIGFQMDARGASKLGTLTSENVGNPMAIQLDGQVYGRPPNINSRISTDGIIQGDYTQAEIDYIVRVLTAGSLQASLSPEPLSVNTIAPELGADNLRQGMNAGLIALVLVSVFMIFYYFAYGGVAVFSLACNAIIILGAMSLARASFTLPGIAGVILTFGMAVDANVLIYERIREELRIGAELRTAVRLGFQRALSSIVDGNVTNLIVCFVLAYTGTQEIKGFAITLGIGVIATMFCSLIITRLIFTLLVDRLKVKKMAMLPMAVPPIEHALEPKINWLSLRPFTIVISLALISLGVSMVVTQNREMLDTEFRGGVQIDLPLQVDEATGEPMTRTRQQIQDLVHALGDAVADDDPIRPLRTAQILPLDPEDDGVTSDEFRVKTYATDTEAVQRAIFQAFGDEGEGLIDSAAPLDFVGQITEDAARAPAYGVTANRLGDILGRAEYRNDVSDYFGGVAVLLEDLSPAPSLESLVTRLELMRGKSDFSSTLTRARDVLVLEGSPEAVRTAVILVSDDQISIIDNPDIWEADLRNVEWDLARRSLTQATTLASVQSFSSIVAQDFQAKAIVSVVLSLVMILIYIWVRFGNVRYSFAAIVTLMHDVTIVIGLIALAEILYDTPSLQPIALALDMEPFKINLNLVAAMLTIIGYSLNDTIIIMDRIRENKGKLPYASKDVVNLSINQTISRTVITSGTTLLAVGILYVFGGQGVHGFAYALLMGVMIGTYSSIAVAAPLVWSRKKDTSAPEALPPGPSGPTI